MKDYIYLPQTKRDFNECFSALREHYHVIKSWVDYIAPRNISDVRKAFESNGIKVDNLTFNLQDYTRYVTDAKYMELYPNYYKDNLTEKTFEHFTALSLLQISAGDIFIDIASEGSPVPEIYSRLTGCKSYRQDIMYPAGLNGDRIGGDACNMPIEDSFADKVCLTCSLEHFEQDGDARLFMELKRILRSNGQACIVPFYVYTFAAIQTDPTISVPNGVTFDNDAVIFCAEGWNNRFGRFYSAASFIKRIYTQSKDFFDFRVFQLTNADEIDSRIYARFALLVTRK